MGLFPYRLRHPFQWLAAVLILVLVPAAPALAQVDPLDGLPYTATFTLPDGSANYDNMGGTSLSGLNDGQYPPNSLTGFVPMERDGEDHLYAGNLIFEFPCPASLTKFILWNNVVQKGGNGVTNFTLHFYNAANVEIGTPVVQSNVSIGVQETEIDLTGLGYNGVTRVVMVITGEESGIEIREVMIKGTSACTASGDTPDDTPVADDSLSTLKICKVAGPGIAVGEVFDFTTDSDIGVASGMLVPAGEGPGGWCVIAARYPPGTVLTSKEEPVPGVVVTGISVFPADAAGTVSASDGQATVTLGAGVTEVTFTNERRTGYLEVCKSGGGFALYRFAVEGVAGEISVPAGACSPALLVNAGPVRITELTTGAIMSGCSTIPASRQGMCDLPGRTSTVTVVPGNISSQTIARIVNQGSAASLRK